MIDQLVALRDSVTRLRAIVEPLGPDQLRASAYPSEWTIADVLSHLGSGAVILRARIAAALAGEEPAEDFAPPIWDEWNAKSPEAQAADALAADQALLDWAISLPEDEVADLIVPLGPLQLEFARTVGLRVNEHVVHTWDIEVALDPTATLPSDAAHLLVDSLGMFVQFTGKPTGTVHDLHVRTTDPVRDFTLALDADSVALSGAETTGSPDLELPAEAFIRLVYGRLDPDHTPTVHGATYLDELRRAFPGV